MLLELSRLPGLRGMPAAAVARLALLGRVKAFGPGIHLTRQGERGTPVHLIVGGRVRIERSGVAGTEPYALAERGPGELVGELQALDGGPRQAAVIAVEETKALQLSPEALALSALHPSEAAAAVGLMRYLERYLFSAEDFKG
jgi:CRP/FNR family transcriptional regulator, cyclic AMP receptor protein